jgi:hypothetical protein
MFDDTAADALLRGDPRELLKFLVAELRDRPSWVLTSNYRAFVNMMAAIITAYEEAVSVIGPLCDRLATTLETALPAWSPAAASLAYVFAILLRNDSAICNSLLRELTRHDNSPKPNDEIDSLERRFEDFNALLVAARQFADALSANAYLYHRFDTAATNSALLSSLSSFTSLAPEAFAGVALHSQDLNSLVQRYRSVTWRKRAHLDGCKTEHQTFRSRLDWLGDNMYGDRTKDRRLIELYEFASAFTHAGVLSTLLSTRKSKIASGDGTGLGYLPSTAAFVEVAFEIADATLAFYCSTYVTAIGTIAQSFLVKDEATQYVDALREIVAATGARVEKLCRQYRYFTATDLCGREWTVGCPCGSDVSLRLGESALCTQCGSMFHSIVLEAGADGVAGSVSPIAVL